MPNRCLREETYRWQAYEKKKCFYIYAIKEIQIKETRDSTTHLLEWPKPKTPTAPKAGKDTKSRNSFTAGNAERHSHSERQFGVFSRNYQQAFIVWSSTRASWYLPNEWKTYVHTETCVQTFTHNCQNLKATETSFHRWTDK